MANGSTGIINYGMGNLRSVQKALEHVGAEAIILDSADQTAGVGRLILPGVGAFADGVANLRTGGWDRAIAGFIATGKPVLGVCLGMQLLFESSEEDAESADQPVKGLGVLPGKVVRFDEERGGGTSGGRIKVPHMGWNTLDWQRDDPLLAGLTPGDAVYFVHSYYVQPTEDEAHPLTSARADYAGAFTATAWRDNVWATQFHPEKSQRVGLKMLENFARL